MLHAMKKFLGLKDYGGMKRFRATAPTKPLALVRKLAATPTRYECTTMTLKNDAERKNMTY